MIWKGLYEGVAYPFEIVCPDGLVRHFAYEHRRDAESDADQASRGTCRLQPLPNSLEMALGPCPGGAHSVRSRVAA